MWVVVVSGSRFDSQGIVLVGVSLVEAEGFSLVNDAERRGN